MIYQADITTAVSPATTKNSPKSSELYVTKGLVYKVEINFPPGSSGLLGVAVFDGGYQVWPSSVGTWFTGDGILINFDDVYLKMNSPSKFLVKTYNDDDTYEHLVTVRIGQVSKEIFMARFLPHLSYKYYGDMLRQLQLEQDTAQKQQAAELLADPFPFLSKE